MKNYYEILEVDTNASTEVIEKAYKVLVRKYHPDIQPKDKQVWAENILKEITIAYETLSDKYLRQQYDMELGVNQGGINYQQKYNNLYSEKEQLEQEINQLKFKNESENFKNKKREKQHKFPIFKSYGQAIGNLIYNETKKSRSERAKDFKALGLTIIIIAILIFIFLKIPFIKNFLFPF